MALRFLKTKRKELYMDIASFILGACSVVVMSSLIVTVVSLVKIKRTIREIDNNLEVAQHNIDALAKETFSELENNRREAHSRFDEVYRSMDSRVDKIMSKISRLELERRGKTPNIPLGPSDFPAYPGYDHGIINCTDNTSNQ